MGFSKLQKKSARFRKEAAVLSETKKKVGFKEKKRKEKKRKEKKRKEEPFLGFFFLRGFFSERFFSGILGILWESAFQRSSRPKETTERFFSEQQSGSSADNTSVFRTNPWCCSKRTNHNNRSTKRRFVVRPKTVCFRSGSSFVVQEKRFFWWFLFNKKNHCSSSKEKNQHGSFQNNSSSETNHCCFKKMVRCLKNPSSETNRAQKNGVFQKMVCFRRTPEKPGFFFSEMHRLLSRGSFLGILQTRRVRRWFVSETAERFFSPRNDKKNPALLKHTVFALLEEPQKRTAQKRSSRTT